MAHFGNNNIWPAIVARASQEHGGPRTRDEKREDGCCRCTHFCMCFCLGPCMCVRMVIYEVGERAKKGKEKVRSRGAAARAGRAPRLKKKTTKAMA